MFSTITQLLFELLLNCFSWFSSIVNSFNALDWVIASITFALGVRLIVMPISGSRLSASDTVRSVRKIGRAENNKNQFQRGYEKGYKRGYQRGG